MPTAHEGPRCVFCRQRPVEPVWRPFCSERCKVLDLARWADGNYRVAGEPLPEPDDREPSSR
ncbi:MAG: DNA gyrase inhibitor YacG [Acidobacteriaceae bacterium]|nr:DNA gyrase inhibitor YacG [Acidobacteriaceae bacterium]